MTQKEIEDLLDKEIQQIYKEIKDASNWHKNEEYASQAFIRDSEE